jgi:hypothetical protein
MTLPPDWTARLRYSDQPREGRRAEGVPTASKPSEAVEVVPETGRRGGGL